MSWYSKIYVFVREYRQLHPFIGFFLHHFLNIMLVIQVICLAYGYYVFMFVTCKYWIGPNVRAVAYMCFYHSLLLLALWSLGMTIGTPIMRVPPKYHADPDTDKRLKSVTPLSGKRYKPDDSDDNQVAEQTRILNDFAASRGLLFAEEDHLGRLRYCYQCNLIKPDRSHHCSSCGFCVVKFDHHCPWINKCVNHANYKYFMLFITYGTLFICISVALQIEVIVRFFMSDMEKTWPMVMPVVFNLMLYGVFSYFPLGELLIYHLKLIAVNETTCEQAKVPLIKGDRLANYNFGWYENYRSVFGWGFWPFPVNTSISDGLHFPINYSDISVGPRYEVVPLSSVKKASLKHSKRSSKRSKRSKHSKATEIPGKSGDATPAKKSHSRSKSSSKDTCSTQTSGSLPLRSATTQQSVDV